MNGDVRGRRRRIAHFSFRFYPALIPKTGYFLQPAILVQKGMNIVKKLLLLFTLALFCSGGTLFAEIGQENEQPKDENAALLSPQKSESTGECKNTACLPASAFSTHKVNYLAFYRSPLADKAQIKFQFSAKYKVLNEDVDLWGATIAGYLAYTQKSFWSIGEPSRPFEESNYNPEAFLSIAPGLDFRRFTLHEIRLSPFEHESNGRDGAESRSWDRRYIEIRAGYGPDMPYPKVDAFTRDRIELDLKLWHAFGYYEQDDHLRAQGIAGDFLDYAGKGELRVKIRNLMPWSWDNQIDLTTRVFRRSSKNNYQVEFQQNFPNLNFSLYAQYWGGYDESLLRFERIERRFYLGFSFCY